MFIEAIVLAGIMEGSKISDAPCNGELQSGTALRCDVPENCVMRMARVELDFISEATFTVWAEELTCVECRLTDSQYAWRWVDWFSPWRWSVPYDGLRSECVLEPVELRVDTSGWTAVCENSLHDPNAGFSWIVGDGFVSFDWLAVAGTACNRWNGESWEPHDLWFSSDPVATCVASWLYVWIDPEVPGDLNGDGSVNVDDLLLCLSLWYVGDPLTGCFGVDDLSEVLRGWTG